MPAAPLPDDVRDLLAKPNPAVITSLRPTARRCPWPPGTCWTATGCW